ncbi:MAG: hypothetical protein KatS3mg028_1415 [Bacteroidia bacterium]|nr:MAG: hypothetical protein KatS3mg028_1415 [Bacteroidia bacterium]GIV34117.1 MAG: hypothetical protein KatS3mg031_1652 [Chitinophagales bacterium]
MQQQAGYILDGISDLFRDTEYKTHLAGLTKYLSYFEIKTNLEQKRDNVDPIIAVANNILSRGLPTKPSIFIEQSFVEVFGLTEKFTDEVGTVSFPCKTDNPDFEKLLLRAFHIIDPRIKSSDQYERFAESWERLGSQYEEEFLFSIIPKYLGQHFVQLIEPQRNFESILRFAADVQEGFERYLTGAINNFSMQHADFALELPFPINGKKGQIIEIDGPQHQETTQKQLDDLRDDAAIKANWEKTVRITTADFRNISQAIAPIKQFADNDYFALIQENYQTPIYSHKSGLDALQFALTPFAIARIQKVILQWLAADYLSLKDEEWNIAIIERDVPGAYLAIEDLKRLLDRLLTLEGKGRKFPEVKLQVFNTQEFRSCKLNRKHQSKIEDIGKIGNKQFDFLIDCSILQRSIIKSDEYTHNAIRGYAIIKSSYAPVSKRRFYTTELIKYAPILVDENTNYRTQEITESYEDEHSIKERQNALESLLADIFRKESFRPGQRSILNRTLQLENVVGLLPTGGGKSLTYQFSVLLQPGIALIVDPIKSLMKDQFEGLQRNNIDAAVFINSSLKTAKERELATNKMVNAEVLFTFISPERLQIKSFRDKITEMTDRFHNYFSYCVVDEAHCVSEWGHDFRTSYLRLGRNARVYCKRKDATKSSKNSEFAPSIPIVGLTATASFDVLSDVQRELDIGYEGVLCSQGMERPELHYKVISTPIDLESVENPNNAFMVKQAVGEAKQIHLLELIRNVPFELESINNNPHALKNYRANSFFKADEKGKYINAGLVFCPHKSERINSGVKSVSAKISRELPFVKVGTYMGSSVENDEEIEKEEQMSEISQEKFLRNELNLLVATKAFGMGIDKPNVRFTVHFNYPSSIEGFYQEAGRAGRDRKNALCYILYSQHSSDKEILESFYQNSFKGELKEKSVIYEILSEITFPADNYSNELTEQLQNELGINAYLNFWPKDNPTRLYLNEAFQRGYGYIDLNNLSIHPDTRTFEFMESNRTLTQLKSLIENNRPTNRNLVTWLTEEIEPKPAPGIEKLLAKAKVGERLSPIVVGFRNDKIKRITEFLKRNAADEFTERIVKKASAYCFNGEDFLANLSKEFYKATGRSIGFQEEIGIEVKKLFPKLRNEHDTFKAVYRLSTIGVVDDYEVDYNSKTLTLFVSKKEDREYINHLHKYLRRYLSEERAAKVLQDVYDYKGNSVIQKCLGYLIDFVYSEIAKKRKAAIDAMEDACNESINKGDKAFREYLDVYFNSKYYPVLVEETEEGKEFSIDLVWKYIDETEGNIDNLKHLRGACVRLLTENPDNGALLLLKSFSLYLINSTNEFFIREAAEEAMNGFRIFKESKEMEFDSFYNAVYTFKNSLLKYNTKLDSTVTEITELLLLNHHNDWLKQFNDKFLTQYERTNT